jgi:hypothetical protein
MRHAIAPASTSDTIRWLLIAAPFHNTDPKPFIWTAKATDILEKVKRARSRLQIIQSA